MPQLMKDTLTKLLCLTFAGIVTSVVPAAAQTVRDCNTFEANARNIYGPYDQTIRPYANGDVRVIALDVGEPAAASYHLMVTYPSAEEPFPLCSLISSNDSLGFHSLDMASIGATYDPARGLIVSLPVQNLIGGDAIGSTSLHLTINQALGTVVAVYNAPTSPQLPAPPVGPAK